MRLRLHVLATTLTFAFGASNMAAVKTIRAVSTTEPMPNHGKVNSQQSAEPDNWNRVAESLECDVFGLGNLPDNARERQHPLMSQHFA